MNQFFKIANFECIKLKDYLTSLLMVEYFYLYQNLREIFTNYFSTNKEIHNYNTRNSSSLHKKFYRTNYTKHALASNGADVWNNLPTQHKKIQD